MDKQNFSLEQIGQMPLHAITEILGTQGLIDRYNLEVAKLPEAAQWQVNQAFLVAAELHGERRRTRELYINHPLRVMLRILVHYEIDDPDILAAALMHDIIEDHRKGITGRDGATIEEALAVVESWFNPRVASILKAVTNPEFDKSGDEIEQYREHIAQAFEEEPDSIPVKISDFTDNGVGIVWTQGPKVHKLPDKYLPTVPVYRETVNNNKYPFKPHVKEHILSQLNLGERRLLALRIKN